jgi:hypothetical protein
VNCSDDICPVCEAVAADGMTLPTTRERARQTQPIELPWHVALYRFLAHVFARPQLDSHGRPRS